jgi:hypothetical protein
MVKRRGLEVKNEERIQESTLDSAKRKSQRFDVRPIVSTSDREISYQVEVGSSRAQRNVVPTSKGDKFYMRAGTEIIADEPEAVHNLDKEAEDIILEHDGLLKKVDRVKPKEGPTTKYNCHGYTFLGGAAWLNLSDRQIETILRENGLTFTDTPHIGDVVLYRDANGKILHSGVVKDIKDGIPIVYSKFAEGSLLKHYVSNVSEAYKGKIEIYHGPDQGARLLNFECPTSATSWYGSLMSGCEEGSRKIICMRSCCSPRETKREEIENRVDRVSVNPSI